ncbi:zinc-dependent metalloprotease [Ferrimonas gelatinilytica]|uniref:Zinc-dependent metalloprotease n=1 Tax=Ferrimonas gelatinilytica TaxID=1255257 RepID=A0ABP9S3W0_9GAMM
MDWKGFCCPAQVGLWVLLWLSVLPLQAANLLEWRLSSQGQLTMTLPPLQQPMLLQSGLLSGVGANEIGLDRGQLGATRMVQFERHGDRLLLRQLNSGYRAAGAIDTQRRAVMEAFADSVLWVGTLEGERVDVTSLVLQDWHGVARALSDSGQGDFALSLEHSLVLSDGVKAFPHNADVDLQLTFVGRDAGEALRSVAADPDIISVRVRYSLIRLPAEPMTPRPFHPDSGFFALSHMDYAQPLGRPLRVSVLPRHRLEKVRPGPAPSPVVEPIVYYLDNATPEPMRSALLEGALWWQSAFTEAGFEDAFRVEIMPEDMDPQDLRYNTIAWVHRVTRGWSYGGSVIDPRSGEILKGHVTLGSLRVRQDHLIFRGLTAGWKDRKEAFGAAEQTALARLRQLSAHEVGHTLGLAHNFAASASGDPSVMDYPHPHITLEKGQVVLAGSYREGLSPWDSYAIAFGYGHYDGPAEQVQATLVAEARTRGLKFLSDPDARGLGSAHPAAQLWDNGEDPVARLSELMAIRARVLAQLGPQALLPGEPGSALGRLMVPLYLLPRYQIDAVASLLGGADYDYEGSSVTSLAPEWQRAALESLVGLLEPAQLRLPARLRESWVPQAYGHSWDREQFGGQQGPVPDWLAPPEAFARLVLEAVLSPARLNRMQQQQWQDPELPGPMALLEALSEQVMLVHREEGFDALIQARLRAVVADHWLSLYHDPAVAPEVRALVAARLRSDANQLERRARRSDERIDAHYRLLAEVMRNGLSDPELRMIPEPLPVPPGSPI